ncbi:MAG: nickel-dependent lactate racemase [Tepidanaerobacteraceae bacterium]|nr:nickel-dependent lactate racemase [Tepidanaerobacteraceae bacterium]
MEIKIPYGFDWLTAVIEDSQVAIKVDVPKVQALEDDKVSQAAWEALLNPIDSPPLDELVKKGNKVVILVDNFARATPAYLILPEIMKNLQRLGASVKIIVANGALWQMNEQQLEAKLGKSILNNIEVIQNIARETSNYRFIGVTRLGTPISVHKEFLDADVRLGIGLTQVNLWGYGGGGKILLPGVCSYETIEWNHRLSTAPGSSFGVLPDSNPIRQDIEEAAEIAGLQMVVNIILNTERKIIDVKAGKPRSVHLASVKKYNEIYSYTVKKQVDISIAGSFPWDSLFAHACWAAVGLDAVTKNGGTMIVASPCPDGIGHITPIKNYLPACPESLARALMDFYYLRAEFWDGVIWYKLLEVLTRKELIVVTQEKNLEGFASIGLEAVSSLNQALELAFDRHGANAKVALIPFAKWCVPKKL